MPAPHPTTLGDDPVARTVSVYDTIAPDFAATWCHDPVMEPLLDRFFALLSDPADVLDAGCGPGRDVLALRRRGAEAVGVDLSEGMLREARRRAPGEVFRRMDLRRLAYPPESFSGVWACASLHHLPAADVPRALGEFVRVLRPGGVLAVAVQTGSGAGYDRIGRYRRLSEAEDFRRRLAEAGLRVVAEDSSVNENPTSGDTGPRTWLNVLAVKEGQGARFAAEEDCPFCPESRFAFNRQAGLPTVGSLLWGDDHFYLFPDIAPMVEGHLLLTSVRHCLCYGAVPTELGAALTAAKEAVRQLFRDAYRRLAVFLEHGPARRGAAGACIDHAHLHCLPLSPPVRRAVEQLLAGAVRAQDATAPGLHWAGESYLSVEDEEGRTAVLTAEALPSQYFRQLLAAAAGRAEWRWQTLCRDPQSRADPCIRWRG